MSLLVIAGNANPVLARAVADRLGVPLASRLLERHPDGELRVEVDPAVFGHTICIVQPTQPNPEAHLLEMLLLADACRRNGAERIVGVMPYFAYARQDRRVNGNEAIGAKVVADMLAAACLDKLVTVDLHNPALEGVFSLPLEHVTAVPLLAREAAADAGPDAVVVSPDLGAVKLAERYARELKAPVAIVHKTRHSGSKVTAHSVVGDVRGKRAILIDDMVSTGGTMVAAVKALLDAGAAAEVTIAVTHALLVGAATEALKQLPIKRIVTTDTIAHPKDLPLPMKVVSVAPLLAEAVERLVRPR